VESLAKLSEVLDRVHMWFTLNKLSLNADKTEYMLIGTRQQRNKLNNLDSRLSFGGCNIQPSDFVRNLGFFMDSELTLSSHVSKIPYVKYLFFIFVTLDVLGIVLILTLLSC